MYRTDHTPAQLCLNRVRTVDSLRTDYPPLEMSADYIHAKENTNIAIGCCRRRNFIQIRRGPMGLLPIRRTLVKIEFRSCVSVDVEFLIAIRCRNIEIDFPRTKHRIGTMEGIEAHWSIFARKP